MQHRGNALKETVLVSLALLMRVDSLASYGVVMTFRAAPRYREGRSCSGLTSTDAFRVLTTISFGAVSLLCLEKQTWSLAGKIAVRGNGVAKPAIALAVISYRVGGQMGYLVPLCGRVSTVFCANVVSPVCSRVAELLHLVVWFL